MDRLPHNTSIEQSIISSILNNPETAEKILSTVSAADFYHGNHQAIIKTACALLNKCAPVDLTSLGTAILEAGLVEKTGGSAYLSSLMAECPVPSSVEYYCEKLRELAERRRLVVECNGTMQDACDLGKPLDDVHERIESVARGAGEARKSRVPSREELVISDDEWSAATLTAPCIVKNLIYADVRTLAAPGGTGKTTICLYEYVHIVLGRRLYGLEANKSGWCLYVTSEDSRERLVARLREIADVMGLTDQEKAVIRRGVVFWDVSGDDVRLISLEDGNVVLTSIADGIIRAHKDDPPVVVTFDPAISFGVGESRINDNEQGLIMAARRIRNGLNCAVQLIHHTGKANAREKSLDQYTARGGSALPDGSRMVTILQSWDPRDNTRRPPPGLSYSPESSVTILARPKLSYAPANLPLIWIKRTGWNFEHFTETYVSDEVRDRAVLDQVERFLFSEEKANVYHSRKSLEGKSETIGLTRQGLRDVIAQLFAAGRIIEKDLPQDLKKGARKTYLAVREKSARFGEIEKNDQTTSPDNFGQSISPPLRKKNGGDIEPPIFVPLPRSRGVSSARFGEIGEINTKSDPGKLAPCLGNSNQDARR